MARKVIISERQLELLTGYIVESNAKETLIKRIVDDLDMNYESTKGTYKKGGEFFEEAMIANKVNGEMMTGKSLLDYMKYKYKLDDDFLKQIIDDWYKGKIDKTYTLSKNVSM